MQERTFWPKRNGKGPDTVTNSPLDKEGPGPRGEPAGRELGLQLMDLNAAEAAEWLGSEPEETIAAALQAVFPGVARGILACLPGDLRERVLAETSSSRSRCATQPSISRTTRLIDMRLEASRNPTILQKTAVSHLHSARFTWPGQGVQLAPVSARRVLFDLPYLWSGPGTARIALAREELPQ